VWEGCKKGEDVRRGWVRRYFTMRTVPSLVRNEEAAAIIATAKHRWKSEYRDEGSNRSNESLYTGEIGYGEPTWMAVAEAEEDEPDDIGE